MTTERKCTICRKQYNVDGATNTQWTMYNGHKTIKLYPKLTLLGLITACGLYYSYIDHKYYTSTMNLKNEHYSELEKNKFNTRLKIADECKKAVNNELRILTADGTVDRNDLYLYSQFIKKTRDQRS